MACRIGITTRPEDRREEWRSRCRGFRNWRILERHNTKTAAQAAENRLARQLGCEAHPGGDGPEYATWSVYYFNHDGCV